MAAALFRLCVLLVVASFGGPALSGGPRCACVNNRALSNPRGLSFSTPSTNGKKRPRSSSFFSSFVLFALYPSLPPTPLSLFLFSSRPCPISFIYNLLLVLSPLPMFALLAAAALGRDVHHTSVWTLLRVPRPFSSANLRGTDPVVRLGPMMLLQQYYMERPNIS